MTVQKIIDKMPEDVRRDVEKQASNAGKTLHEFVEDSLKIEIVDSDLDDVSGGGGNRIEIGANFGGDVL